MPRRGFSGKGKNITTKHDEEACGRKNTARMDQVIRLPLLAADLGDEDKLLQLLFLLLLLRPLTSFCSFSPLISFLLLFFLSLSTPYFCFFSPSSLPPSLLLLLYLIALFLSSSSCSPLPLQFAPEVQVGDGVQMDLKLSNQVFNSLKRHCDSEQRRSARLHEKKEHSTSVRL